MGQLKISLTDAPSDLAKQETTQIWPAAHFVLCIFFFWANSPELTSFFR